MSTEIILTRYATRDGRLVVEEATFRLLEGGASSPNGMATKVIGGDTYFLKGIDNQLVADLSDYDTVAAGVTLMSEAAYTTAKAAEDQAYQDWLDDIRAQAELDEQADAIVKQSCADKLVRKCGLTNDELAVLGLPSSTETEEGAGYTPDQSKKSRVIQIIDKNNPSNSEATELAGYLGFV